MNYYFLKSFYYYVSESSIIPYETHLKITHFSLSFWCNCKSQVIYYTYVFASSMMMPVARLGLDRDAGWFPKSSFPQLKPLYQACFHHSAPQALL